MYFVSFPSQTPVCITHSRMIQMFREESLSKYIFLTLLKSPNGAMGSEKVKRILEKKTHFSNFVDIWEGKQNWERI